jgi:hypothetical protein
MSIFMFIFLFFFMFMFMLHKHENRHGITGIRIWTRTSVKNNVGLRPPGSDIRSSDIRLSLMSFIEDFRLSVRLWVKVCGSIKRWIDSQSEAKHKKKQAVWKLYRQVGGKVGGEQTDENIDSHGNVQADEKIGKQEGMHSERHAGKHAGRQAKQVKDKAKAMHAAWVTCRGARQTLSKCELKRIKSVKINYDLLTICMHSFYLFLFNTYFWWRNNEISSIF